MSSRMPLGVLPAFVRRDFAIARSYRFPLLLDGLGVVIQLAIVYFIGQAVTPAADAPAGLAEGYFPYAAVGVAVLGMLQAAITSFGHGIREQQLTGTLEMLFAAPVPAWLIVAGSGAYEVIRDALLAPLTLVLAVVVFGLGLDLDIGRAGNAVLAIVAALGLTVAIGLAVAAFTFVFHQSASAAGPASLLLTVISGVWFPVAVLPAPLDAIAEAIPLTWALDSLRAALLGIPAEPWQLAGSLAAAGLALACALLLLRAALGRARSTGALARY